MSERILNTMMKKGEKAYDELMCATHDPLAKNTAFLLEHLRKNKDTEIGKKYKFKDINSIEAFKAAVPLLTYDDYSVYVDKLKREKYAQLLKKKQKYFSRTSGSIGNPKLIPVSEEAISDILENHLISLHSTQHLYTAGKHKYGRHLAIFSYVDVKTLPGEMQVGDITSLAMYKQKRNFNHIYTTPACSVFANQFHDFNYIHARFALISKDITCISSAFMSGVYELINYIIKNHESLISDIEKGRIHYDADIPEYMRSELKSLVRSDPGRAGELREIFNGSDYKGILKKIWPDLLVINAGGNASFRPYTQRVKEYAGSDVSFFNLAYAASEGQIGTVTDTDDTKFCLLPHRMFYEFIPLEDIDKPNPETLTIDRLELDKEYEIVLTNLSGFYRYRINDIVKVTGFINKTPQVVFRYRKNQIIDIAGEKTTYAHLEDAVDECAKELGVFITEFAVYPDFRSSPGHYTLLLETGDSISFDDTEKISKVLHQKLCIANPKIKRYQDNGSLGVSTALLVQPQTFALYKDMLVMRGASINQFKPVRLIDTPEKEKFFFALLERSL